VSDDVPPGRRCTLPGCEREARDPTTRGSLCPRHVPDHDDEPGDAYGDSDLDADALLSDDAPGVSLTVRGQQSEIELEFDEGATSSVNGYLYQILRAEGEQGQQTWSGEFPVRRP